MQVIYQNEVSECGYACLAMVLTHLGRATEVRELSAYRPISANGIDMTDLYDVASEFGLEVEAYRFGADDLREVKKGSIIHFGGSHFVVFEKLGRGHVRIIDPATGRRTIALQTFMGSTSGYLLECKATPAMPRIKIKSRVPAAVARVFALNPDLKAQIARVLFVTIGSQFAILALPYFGKLILDQVVTADNRDLLNVLALTFGSIFAIGAFSHYVSQYLTELMHQRTEAAVTESLFFRLLRNPIGYFEKRHVGDLFTRIKSQTEVNAFTTSSFIRVAIDLVIGLLALVLMLIQSPLLSGIAIVIFCIYLGVSFMLFPRMLDMRRRVVEESARCDDALIETVRAAPLIKLAQGEVRRTALFMVRFKSLAAATLQRSRLDSLRGALLQFIGYADTIVIAWLAAILMIEGKISVGVFYSFLLYKTLFSSHLATAINTVFQYFMLSVPVARVDDILETEAERYTPLADVHRAAEVRDFESIEMRDVAFSYGISDTPVLRKVDLDIRKGDKIAIVGPSGSGKSTIFKLLTAAESLQEGHMALNGIVWPNLMVDEIRQHSANMRQGDIILHGSIADNVSMFALNVDEDKVLKVLGQVGLLNDVMQLPMRTRTIISDSIANISAGQRQRLLLARALYQERELYLLDEPTSNLDPDSVQVIAKLLQSLERTLVVITHDVSLAATFPVRYRLTDGCLVAQ